MEQDQAIDSEEARMQRAILDVLLDSNPQRPWSIGEFAREFERLGSRVDVEDAVAELHGVGLVNRADQLVFPSRAAVHFKQLGVFNL
jgi:hypothetical protein